jgi:hypothetical protein
MAADNVEVVRRMTDAVVAYWKGAGPGKICSSRSSTRTSTITRCGSGRTAVIFRQEDHLTAEGARRGLGLSD